jgi:hypothetical protein
MKESTTYQAIKNEGREECRLEEIHDDIRDIGVRKFRSPLPEHVRTALEAILDLARLEDKKGRTPNYSPSH